MATDNSEVQDNAADEAEIAEAKSLGWSDKEHWRGDEKHWVDAKTFLEKARPVMGVLKQQNSELRGEVQALAANLRAATAAIEALEESHDADVREQVEAARADLRKQLADASREGRHEDVATITEKMTELNTASAAADDKGEKGKDKGGKGDQPHPEVVAWYRENPEFISDPNRVALGQVAAAQLRQAGDTTIGKVFLDKVAAKVDEVLGKKPTGRSKVEGGNGGGGRSSDRTATGKSYADLPQEAKDACEKQAKRLVGPTRAHKTIESWRDSYVRQYFAE